MLKTNQFKTHCKGDNHNSKNCKYHFARTRDKTKVNVLTSASKIKYSNSCSTQHNAVEFEHHFACTTMLMPI